VRLDKFLQVSRLIRRRTLANTLCRAGRVTVNGRHVVPATPVRPGDIVAIELVRRRLRARVRAIPATSSKVGNEECCEILDDTPLE
jgi:ribosomal 50S subunit-recycling heat shock protein